MHKELKIKEEICSCWILFILTVLFILKYLLDFGYLGHLKINLLVNAYQNLSVAKEGYVCK